MVKPYLNNIAMTYGYRNKILRVNLSDRSVNVDQPGEAFFKKLLGGRNIAAWYLNKEVSGECDPLGPENKIVVATSILTGSPIPGTSRFTVAAKSPLTDCFGDSQAGGFFGPELKYAGYDAIIVEGKAEKPCYISITNDKVEIKDASYIWGKETGPAQDIIREELGEKKTRVLQTGPAGEKMVRFAALTNELKHWNGRCGMGAVFGSKNLRAIAVKGKDRNFMKEVDKLREYAKWFGKNFKENEGFNDFGKKGTMQVPTILDAMGLLPTENFQKGSFDKAAEIDGKKIHEEIHVGREGCYACPVNCKQVVAHKSEDENRNIDPRYGAPEYETLGSIGSNCSIGDMVAVCKGNELLARYGMDSISTGVTIAFAMECYQKGLITKEDTGGVELVFGSTEALFKMIKMIAHREGFGDVLAEGSYRAAMKIGKGAEKFSMTSKKLEFAAHEPRGKWNVGLGYAVSPNGADHIVVGHDHCFMGEPNMDKDALTGPDLFPLMKFGCRKPIEPCAIDHEKVRMFIVLQKMWSIYDTLDICIFVGEPERRFMTLEHIVDLINNITGWDISLYELMDAGERGNVMARLFNAKCGITSNDEILPDRMFEPLGNGALEGMKIDREQFDEAKSLYYQMAGMDEMGKPLFGKAVQMKVEELWN